MCAPEEQSPQAVVTESLLKERVGGVLNLSCSGQVLQSFAKLFCPLLIGKGAVNQEAYLCTKGSGPPLVEAAVCRSKI